MNYKFIFIMLVIILIGCSQGKIKKTHIDECYKPNWFINNKENYANCECKEWLNSSDNFHSRTPIQIFEEVYWFIGKYRDYKFEECHFNIPPDSFKNYSEWLSTPNGLTCSQHNVCIKSRPKTECEKGNPKFILINLSNDYENIRTCITNQPLEYQGISCCKKNQCELGNPAWVKETEIKEVDTSNIPHPTCRLQQGWFCPSVGIVNLPCDNTTGKCYLHYDFETNSMGLAYIGCEYKKNVCISNQTICREKT